MVDGETQVTISASGYTSVIIWCTKLDHNFDKPILPINMPNLSQAMTNETEPVTKIVDIGRVKEIVTIQGYLIDETSESALTKKKNLLKILKFKKEVTVTWGTSGVREQTVDGNIQKLAVSETTGIIGNAQQSGYYSEKNFAVQLAVISGEDTS